MFFESDKFENVKVYIYFNKYIKKLGIYVLTSSKQSVH